MTEEVQARIFEPFFTTKMSGKGTGLGLASIFGFVKQSGGHVSIYSEVGHGTCLSVYMPKCVEVRDRVDVVLPIRRQKTPDPRIERILVVENNEGVRKITVKRLNLLDFETVAVAGGDEAIQSLESALEFSLVLSDIVMDGGKSGYDVARWVQKNKPSCKILLTSGFTDKVAEKNNVKVDKLKVLQKPYSLGELKDAIDGALDNTIVHA